MCRSSTYVPQNDYNRYQLLDWHALAKLDFCGSVIYDSFNAGVCASYAEAAVVTAGTNLESIRKEFPTNY